MNNVVTTCCFTGHRKIPLQDIPLLKEGLKKTLVSLIEKGIDRFCAGGALGFDTLAAQTVLKLKEDYPHISLYLILPCKEQTRGWPSKDIQIYEYIISKSDKVIYTSENYFRGCMHVRNRALVDMSSYMVCYLTEKTGGTAYTVDYAKKSELEIYNLAENII